MGAQHFGPTGHMSGQAGPDQNLEPGTAPSLPYVPGLILKDQHHPLSTPCTPEFDLEGPEPSPPGPPHRDWVLGPSTAPTQPCALGEGTLFSIQGLKLSMEPEIWQQGSDATAASPPNF